MIQTTIWIPPSLCGCQLKMTADFTDGSVVDGVSYRHPKPFTITSIAIINVCANHKSKILIMPSILNLFDSDPINGGMKQNRGYLKHPIIAPTEAECLYTFLSQYGGQIHGYPCGCKTHQFVDEKGNATYLEHPINNQKCFAHKDDSSDMQQAKMDFEQLIADSS